MLNQTYLSRVSNLNCGLNSLNSASDFKNVIMTIIFNIDNEIDILRSRKLKIWFRPFYKKKCTRKNGCMYRVFLYYITFYRKHSGLTLTDRASPPPHDNDEWKENSVQGDN